MFLLYLLVERILEGAPTIFQLQAEQTFVFTGPESFRVYNAAEVLPDTQYAGAWYLMDSNVSLQQPRAEFHHPSMRVFILQSTSPQPRWWKEWSKYLGARLVVMKAWSWKELYIGGFVDIIPLRLLY